MSSFGFLFFIRLRAVSRRLHTPRKTPTHYITIRVRGLISNIIVVFGLSFLSSSLVKGGEE